MVNEADVLRRTCASSSIESISDLERTLSPGDEGDDPARAFRR